MREIAKCMLLANIKHQVDTERVVNAMIEFARSMCELQKQECADSAEIKDIGVDRVSNRIEWGIDESSILECNNVCG